MLIVMTQRMMAMVQPSLRKGGWVDDNDRRAIAAPMMTTMKKMIRTTMKTTITVGT